MAYQLNFIALSGHILDKGLISLLPKGNKDSSFLKNWQPLTLLNLDNKILAKVLATRLKKVIQKIIGFRQTVFFRKKAN